LIYHFIKPESKSKYNLLNMIRFGIRWCNEKDVLTGKGVKYCANSKCDNMGSLTSFEVYNYLIYFNR